MNRTIKQWPLLFGADMVLALRADKKTQTRRRSTRWRAAQERDIAWTREKWAVDVSLDKLAPHVLSEDVDLEYLADGARRKNRASFEPGRARPGIYLPHWASRDEVLIREVRVQRLQDITDEDAEAEGICALEGQVGDEVFYAMAKRIGGTAIDARVWYAILWEKINGAGSWDANPEIVALTFERRR